MPGRHIEKKWTSYFQALYGSQKLRVWICIHTCVKIMYISAYLCPVRAEIFNQTSHPKTGQSGSKPVTWQPYQHIWLQLVSFTVQNESLCCVPSQPVTTDSDPVMLVSLVLHQCQCFSEVAISVDFSSALQFCGSCIVLVIRPRVLISAGLLHCDQPASHYSSFGRMFW